MQAYVSSLNKGLMGHGGKGFIRIRSTRQPRIGDKN